MFERSIYVTFQREGIHKYPAAANIAGVEFLANEHRHIFHFKVMIQVFHDDRDIEFILFKRELESIFGDQLSVNNKSCEMLATDLINYLINKYTNRSVEVTVSEDGENGAIVKYNAKGVDQ